MEIKIQWHQPIPLKDGSLEDEIEAWDGYAGVYMFCRKYDESVIPMYIGRSQNIYNRIREHLGGQTGLMDSIKAIRQQGEKILIIGEYIPKRGLSSERAIRIVERGLIEHALTEGYELLNISGTKTPKHAVQFLGFKGATRFSGRKMYIKAAG